MTRKITRAITYFGGLAVISILPLPHVAARNALDHDPLGIGIGKGGGPALATIAGRPRAIDSIPRNINLLQPNTVYHVVVTTLNDSFQSAPDKIQLQVYYRFQHNPTPSRPPHSLLKLENPAGHPGYYYTLSNNGLANIVPAAPPYSEARYTLTFSSHVFTLQPQHPSEGQKIKLYLIATKVSDLQKLHFSPQAITQDCIATVTVFAPAHPSPSQRE